MQHPPKLGAQVFYFSPGALPLPAVVCRVHSPGVVNLCVFSADGTTQARTSVQYEETPAAQSTAWSHAIPAEKKPAK